jgi:hypothetical protein
MAQIRQISNEKNSKLPESYNNFQKVGSQEYRRILVFFLLSYILCSQIWLNYFLDSCHFGYITKSLKETLTRRLLRFSSMEGRSIIAQWPKHARVIFHGSRTWRISQTVPIQETCTTYHISVVCSCAQFLWWKDKIRVNRLVIVHLKTQRNFVIWADLGFLWGPKMSCRGALGAPSAL